MSDESRRLRTAGRPHSVVVSCGGSSRVISAEGIAPGKWLPPRTLGGEQGGHFSSCRRFFNSSRREVVDWSCVVSAAPLFLVADGFARVRSATVSYGLAAVNVGPGRIPGRFNWLSRDWLR